MAFFSAAQAAAQRGETVNTILLCRLEFEGAERRLWHGFGDIEVAGEIWEGAGAWASISEIGGGGGDSAQAVTLTMSGVDAQITRLAASEIDLVRERPMTLYLATFDEAGNLLDGLAPVNMSKMDTLSFFKSVQSQVATLVCEGWLTNRASAPNAFYSDRDQQARHPGDKGFQHTALLVNRQVKWPG